MNIFRNRFLGTSAYFLDKPNEGQEEDTRTDAQKERDAINVEGSVSSDKDKVPPKEPDEDEGKEEDNDEDNNEDDDDEDKEDDENDEENKELEVKPKEETDDEKKVRIAKEKEDRREARVQKRIDKAVAAQKIAETRAAELEKQLAAKPVEGLTEEEVERRASAKSEEALRIKQAKDLKESFEKNIDKLEGQAVKIDADFNNKIANMVTELGMPIPSPVMNELFDLDNENGADVLVYLTNNIDEAEDIFELTGSRLVRRIMRLSDKIKEEKAVKPKPRSSLPPPIQPVEGNGRPLNAPLTGKENMDDFARKREKQVEERRKLRGY